MRKWLLLAGGGAAVAALLVSLFVTNPLTRRLAVESPGDRDELPPAVARKLAAAASFSPGSASEFEDHAGGSAMQDWIEHATPGDDIPFAAFAGARKDWDGFKARPAVGAGAWTPLGPTYGKNPANPYRDRSV